MSLQPLNVALLVILLAGCPDPSNFEVLSDQTMTANEQSKERMNALIKRANTGDEAAIKELQQYFFGRRDTKNYYFWVEKEAGLGKPDAMQRLALRLSGLGGRENCARAEQLLTEALSKKITENLRSAMETDLKVLRGEMNGVKPCK